MEQQEPNREIIETFRKRKLRQLLISLPVIAAVIPMILMDEDGQAFYGIPVNILMPVCLVIILCGVFFSFFNWRCPSCNGYLGKGMSPKFCVKCGSQLQ